MRHTVALQDSVNRTVFTVYRFTHDCTDGFDSVFLSLMPLFRSLEDFCEDVNRFVRATTAVLTFG